MVKQTAGNNQFLKRVKAQFSAGTYKRVLELVNTDGIDAAFAWLTKYATNPKDIAEYRVVCGLPPVETAKTVLRSIDDILQDSILLVGIAWINELTTNPRHIIGNPKMYELLKEQALIEDAPELGLGCVRLTARGQEAVNGYKPVEAPPAPTSAEAAIPDDVTSATVIFQDNEIVLHGPQDEYVTGYDRLRWKAIIAELESERWHRTSSWNGEEYTRRQPSQPTPGVGEVDHDAQLASITADMKAHVEKVGGPAIASVMFELSFGQNPNGEDVADAFDEFNAQIGKLKKELAAANERIANLTGMLDSMKHELEQAPHNPRAYDDNVDHDHLMLETINAVYGLVLNAREALAAGGGGDDDKNVWTLIQRHRNTGSTWELLESDEHKNLSLTAAKQIEKELRHHPDYQFKAVTMSRAAEMVGTIGERELY